MLSHTHPMSDPDAIFTIDPTTRVISTNVKKIVLMQYDHNSEIFTFSIPQFVEGHDMSLCNKIEIHYTNINKRTREQSNDVYPVTDKQVESDNLVFTWLLSGNATKYPGSLNFIIRFECVEDDGSISYMWNTDIFKNVTVSDGISNTETVIEDYSDILEQWKSDCLPFIPERKKKSKRRGGTAGGDRECAAGADGGGRRWLSFWCCKSGSAKSHWSRCRRNTEH